MDHDQLRDALQKAVRLRQRGEQTEHDAILAALRGGMKLADIVAMTDRSRETLRRMAREAGIPLRRQPTVVSKREAPE